METSDAIQHLHNVLLQGGHIVPALLGSTAAGKTDLALQFKQLCDQAIGKECVRLINVDSVQCYRELEIGTAKPSQQQRQQFALMDFLAPDQPYSVAHYATDAAKAIAHALADAKLPLLVGGSMMYFRVLEKGLSPLPASDPQLRKNLQKQLAAKGYTAMLAELQSIDAPYAKRLAANDSQRLLRGLEVFYLTGKPLSGLQKRKSRSPSSGYRMLPVFMHPDKAWVNQRIAQRLDAMLQAGLVQEVKALRSSYSHALDMSAFRSVGYRQVLDMLAGLIPQDELYERILFATRQLAKRQRTWFRQWPQAEYIHTTNINQQLYQLVSIVCRYTGTIRT